MQPRVTFVYAVTAHGFGHWTRSAAILNALGRVAPGVRWIVSGGVDDGLVTSSLAIPHERRARRYEPGAVQRSCFEVDILATRAAYHRFFEMRDALLKEEIDFLRSCRARAVVVDVPALPVRAAAELGLPAIGISNFTWDWVLAPVFSTPAEEWVLRNLAADYGQGARHLLLPLGQQVSPFAESEPAPIVARRARLAPSTVRAGLGIPEDGRALVLVCVGGWSASNWPAVYVPGCADFHFVTVGDLPIEFEAPSLRLSHSLPAPLTFPDLVNASACVIAKPGYGTTSECLIHRTPLLAIHQPGFRETPLLLGASPDYGPVWVLSIDDFYSGRWEVAIRGLLQSSTPWADVPTDGAERVARRVAELLSL